MPRRTELKTFAICILYVSIAGMISAQDTQTALSESYSDVLTDQAWNAAANDVTAIPTKVRVSSFPSESQMKSLADDFFALLCEVGRSQAKSTNAVPPLGMSRSTTEDIKGITESVPSPDKRPQEETERLVISTASQNAGQNRESSGNKKQDDRTTEPQAKIPPSRTFNHHWEIETEYDKFKNVTVVRLRSMELPEASTSFGSTHPLSVTALYSCFGKTTACWPVTVWLNFEADTESWLYHDVDRTLIFLVDGRRITAPSAGWHGSVVGAESLLEQMASTIPTSQFLRIIQGHHVEGQIAFTTFDFTDENLEALRDLMSRMRPAGRKTNSAPEIPLLHPATLTAQAPPEYDVKFATTKGDFVIRVVRAWAPLGADRFYNLVKNHFYDETSFFRYVDFVQFGLSGNAAVNKAWRDADINDDPVRASNKLGFITFMMAGKDTRTTQVFINLGNNSRLDVMGFAPFGQVTSGMDVVQSFYSGYADAPKSHQGEITTQGKAYLDANFPRLDSIKTAIIVAPGGQPDNSNPMPNPAEVERPETPSRIRVGGNAQAAALVRKIAPVYPPIAKTAHISGTVVLHAVIAKDGSVEDLQYVSGPPLLMKAAMDAVRQWRYEPKLVNDEPVEVDTTISVVFGLGP